MEKVTLKQLLSIDKEALKGKIICFPTDTVYGVGALANDTIAVEKIYKMKGRDEKKSLPILCSKISQVLEYSKDVSDSAMMLMEKYWPGALTIILTKKDGLLDHINKETIAFRMPNSKIALDIIDHFSILATTSVNISGEKEINSVLEISNKFSSWIDYLVLDEEKFLAIPSTVVDATKKELKVLREGMVKI